MSKEKKKETDNGIRAIVLIILFSIFILATTYGWQIFKEKVIKPWDFERIYSYGDYVEPGADAGHPIYAFADYSTTFSRRLLEIRYYIYKYTLSELKIFGNTGNSVSVWLMHDFYLYHAHNSFLMILYLFGVFSGLFFVCLGITSVVSVCKHLWELKHKEGFSRGYIPYIFSLCVLIAYFITSLTECITYPGEMGFTLLFIALLPIVRKIEFKDE